MLKKKAKLNKRYAAYLVALEWILLLSPFLLGTFFPWTAAILSVSLSILLLLMRRDPGLCRTESPVFLAASAIVLFLLLGGLWGTDHGMALIAVVQFLPMPLFVLALEQFEPQERNRLFRSIPYAACAMVLLSLLLSRIVRTEGWFLVSGRQAGFFQYPNTYALYLLLAAVLLLFDENKRLQHILMLLILLSGIALSGSRTVFVLLLGVLVYWLFWEKSRTLRLWVAGGTVLLLGAGILYALLTGSRAGFGRFLSISLSSSEFLGRLLYARDALPVILKHPLGLGYLGYFWTQGSFQTGVYQVMHIHNELLQLLLDVGWIPTGLFLYALVKSLRSPLSDIRRRVFLLTLCLHSLFDFDTQFLAVAMLLLLAMDVEPKGQPVQKQTLLPALILTVGMVLSLWIGSASFQYYLRHNDKAAEIYPGYTMALVNSLYESANEAEESLNGRILRLNDSVAAVYDRQAAESFRSGDYPAMVEQKRTVIRLSRYSLREYLEYFELLRSAYESSARQGDENTSAWCLQHIREIPGMMNAVRDQTSSLGWKIKDQPNLRLPESVTIWLNTHL